MFANVICRREVNNPSSYFSGLGSRWFVTQPFGQLRAYPSLRHAGTYCISLCYYLLSIIYYLCSLYLPPYPWLSAVAVGISCTNFPKPGSTFTGRSRRGLQRSLGHTGSALCQTNNKEGVRLCGRGLKWEEGRGEYRISTLWTNKHGRLFRK